MSGFFRYVDDAVARLGFYAAYFGSSLATFRDSIPVPSSRVKQSKKNKRTALPLNMLSIGCPKPL
jgi:hypothetical protein